MVEMHRLWLWVSAEIITLRFVTGVYGVGDPVADLHSRKASFHGGSLRGCRFARQKQSATPRSLRPGRAVGAYSSAGAVWPKRSTPSGATRWPSTPRSHDAPPCASRWFRAGAGRERRQHVRGARLALPPQRAPARCPLRGGAGWASPASSPIPGTSARSSSHAASASAHRSWHVAASCLVRAARH